MASSLSFKRPVNVAAPAAPVAPAAAAPQAPAAPSPIASVTVVNPAPAPTATQVVQAPPVQAPAVLEPVGAAVGASALAVAPANTNSLTVANDDYQGVGGFEGEWSAKDMATPYLAIMQKQSKNFDDHVDWLGQWVYDKEICLGEEVRVVFIRASKYYLEDIPYGSEEIPGRFNTLADARAAGLTESQIKESADLDLLIEVDASIEGVGDLAHIIDGTKGYVLARYSVRSSAYGKTAGVLAKDHSGFLKGNLINGFYRMATLQKKNDKGSWHVPVLKPDGKTLDSLKTQIIARMAM